MQLKELKEIPKRFENDNELKIVSYTMDRDTLHKLPIYNEFEKLDDCIRYYKKIMSNIGLMFDFISESRGKGYDFHIFTALSDVPTAVYLSNKIKVLNNMGIQSYVHYINLPEGGKVTTEELTKLINEFEVSQSEEIASYAIIQKCGLISDRTFDDLFNLLFHNDKFSFIDIEFLDIRDTSDNLNKRVYKYALEEYKKGNLEYLAGVPTPAGAVNLIISSPYYKNILFGDRIVNIYGRSNILGKPLFDMLLDLDVTPRIFHSRTDDKILYSSLKNNSVNFLCLMNENISNYIDLKAKENKNSKISYIDFGIGRNSEGKLHGNVTRYVLEKSNEMMKSKRDHLVTPTPQGTGITTIVQLVINILITDKYKLEKRGE